MITLGQVYRHSEGLRRDRPGSARTRARGCPPSTARPRIVVSSTPCPRPDPNRGGGPVTSVARSRASHGALRAMRITPFIKKSALALAVCGTMLAGTAHAQPLHWAHQGNSPPIDPMALKEQSEKGRVG